MKKETSELKTNVVMLVKGIAKFPFVEEGKFSAKLCITDDELERIEAEIECLGEELSVGYLAHHGEDYSAINVKTGFEIPIFDIEGNPLTEDDYEIYDGAKVIMKVNFKVYVYKEKKGKSYFTKTGVTGYLMGATVIEQGTKFNNQTTFEEFKDVLNVDDLQF